MFVSHSTDFEALSENPQEYGDLLNGLYVQYQPVGKAEQVEVERIVLCYWMLKRAWRHENAINLAARRDFVRRELDGQREYCQERHKEEEAVILELQNATKEIEDTGGVSQELKQRMFALIPSFEELGLALDKFAQERIEDLGLSRRFQKLNPHMRSRVLASFTVTKGIAYLEPTA